MISGWWCWFMAWKFLTDTSAMDGSMTLWDEKVSKKLKVEELIATRGGLWQPCWETSM